LLLVLLGVISHSAGRSIAWTGANETLEWNVPGNWDGFIIPTNQDDVSIKLTTKGEITISTGSPAAARSLTIVSVNLQIFLPFTVETINSVDSTITVFTTTENTAIFGEVSVSLFDVVSGAAANVSTLQADDLYIFEGAVLNIAKSADVETLHFINGKLLGSLTTSVIITSTLLFVDSFDAPSNKISTEEISPKLSILKNQSNERRKLATEIREKISGKSIENSAITPAIVSGLKINTNQFVVYIRETSVTSEILFENGGTISSNY